MAVRQQIDIEIGPDGEIKLKVRGASGSECLEWTAALEKELGVVVDRTMTSEYYQEEVENQQSVKVGED